MAALDVITLDNAKYYLAVDFTDDDAIISGAITAAVDWVERYTNHLLYERDVVYKSTGCPIDIYDYPVAVQSVKDGQGNDLNYTTQNRSLKLIVEAPRGAIVTVKAGYDSPAKVPGQLMSACYKLITYLYENRDTHSMQLPVDVQGLLNQLRRGWV